MIDLDEWQMRQKAANKYAAQLAMWRLSQRFGWGIPHPGFVIVTKVRDDIIKSFTTLGVSMSKVIKRINSDVESLGRNFIVTQISEDAEND